MIFSDPHFLFWIFLPFATFCIIDRLVLLPFALRFSFVVGLSVLYYYLGPGSSMPLLAAYVVGNFLLLRPIDKSDRAMVIVAVINIAALFYIKAVRPGGAPLGISFHAFQIVGLLVARIQRPQMPIPTYGYFLFLTFFPQLAAGPIVHWNRVHRFFEHWRKQERRTIALDIVLLFVAIGLGKKVFVSDTLYEVVHHFESGGAFVGIDSLVFPFLYSVYLYFDFSSYSDIATGIARMIGMRMPINFYSPYKASNPIMFWRRWHRTLYKFLRNDLRFLYHWLKLPGGTLFVVFVFLFSGFWHGAAWGYTIWAIGHLAYFLLYPRRLMRRIPLALSIVANFVVVSLLWLPFSLGGTVCFDGLRAFGILSAKSGVPRSGPRCTRSVL
jgi:D-alanyl-lipoteichoic acid acyltransferase DltB (MBOAT superfamily)